jgi:DNA end-binding protein Ku
MMGRLLRYPYEVRDEKEYFDDIRNVRVTNDMLDLAEQIVNQRKPQPLSLRSLRTITKKL